MSTASEENKVVAFVSNSAWSVFNFRLDVIRHLMQRGYGILVMAPDDEYSAYLVDCGCKFVSIDFNNKTENPFLDYFFYRQLKQLTKKHRRYFTFKYVPKPNIYSSIA